MTDRLQPQDPIGGEKPSDLDKVVSSVKEHPLRYVFGLLLVVGVGLGLLFYSTSVQARSEATATKLLRAATTEDPAERLAKLDSVVPDAGKLTPEALYLKAENAFALDEYDTARAAFEEVVSKYPDYQFAPSALEGLGFIEEAQGNYDAAVVHYLDVQVKYPNTYAARRQHYNLGRAYGAQGKAKEAVDSYRRQIGEFPESVLAGRAQHKLHEYRGSNPELFQEFEELFTEPVEETPEMDLVIVPDDAEAVPTPEEADAAPAPEELPADPDVEEEIQQ